MKHKRPLLIILALLVVAGGVGAIYKLRHHSAAHLTSTAKTTSKATTAQNNFQAGDSRTSSSDANTDSGGAVDTSGQKTTTTSQSVSSASGDITLNQPTENQVISSGLNLNGTASVDAVQYRIIDDDAGVLAQGQLSVVNGKYSGTVQFQSHGSSGEVDVYSLNPTSGAEENNIRVDVKF